MVINNVEVGSEKHRVHIVTFCAPAIGAVPSQFCNFLP